MPRNEDAPRRIDLEWRDGFGRFGAGRIGRSPLPGARAQEAAIIVGRILDPGQARGRQELAQLRAAQPEQRPQQE